MVLEAIVDSMPPMLFCIFARSPFRLSIFLSFVFKVEAEVFFVMLAWVEVDSLLFFAWFVFSVASFLFREAMSPLSLLTVFWYVDNKDTTEPSPGIVHDELHIRILW